jgi:dienelactone hydrolase
MVEDTLKKISLIFVLFVLILLLKPITATEPKFIPPDKKGPYKIGYYHIVYLTLPYGLTFATIRYPAESNDFLAKPNSSAAPYPGIIVSNGWSGSAWNIKWLPEHLTSHGYITLCFTPPNKRIGITEKWASCFTKGIAKLKTHNKSNWLPISALLDNDKFGAIGLSMGGAGCIAATGAKNSEIDSAVALAPFYSYSALNASEKIEVPTQIIIGSNDGFCEPEYVLPFYTKYIKNSTIKEYIEIKGANHIGFIDEYYAKLAEKIGIDKPKGIKFSEQRRLSRKYLTSWFNYFLKDEKQYYPFIFGDDILKDYNSEILTDLRINYPSNS